MEFDIADCASKLQAALEAFRRAEQRSLAGLSTLNVIHEIRNPLEALTNIVYLTNQYSADQASVRRYMSLAKEQLVNIDAVVCQALNFARTSESAKVVDVAPVVEAALRVHTKAIQAKGVILIRDLAENSFARVPAGQMLQVISNAIANAVDAVAGHGTICVRLWKSATGIQLIVADNGQGISKANMAKVFQAFFTTKGDLGTGLGLALSREIVEKNGGDIRLRSTDRQGRSGTVLRISLPRPIYPLNSPSPMA